MASVSHMTPDAADRLTDSGNDSPLRRIAVIALAAIMLGFAVQLLILAARLAAGGPMPGAAVFLDMTQGVTWSLLVCTGVGIGVSIRARSAVVGMIGLISAPIAVGAAKASQRIVASLLDAAEQQAVLSLGSISVLRAVEYGILGFVLGTLAQRGEMRLSRYLGAGAAAGIVLGGAVLALTAYVAALAGTPFDAPKLAAGVVNEMVFPMGCALVIYAGQLAGRTFNRVELALN